MRSGFRLWRDETPRIRKCKLDFDLELRAIYACEAFTDGPDLSHDCAIIPSIKAEDGDPRDVLTITTQTYPRVVFRCNPAGFSKSFKGRTSEDRNDRVFAAPDRSPLEVDIADVRRLPAQAAKYVSPSSLAQQMLSNEAFEFSG